MTDWITTGEANEIMDLGVCDKTFRNKFKGVIRCRQTPGGHYRWDRESVNQAKQEEPEHTL